MKRLLLPLALLLALAACADPAPSAEPATPPSTTADSPGPASGTSQAPDPADDEQSASTPETLRWQARTVDGEPFDAADLTGKPTVLWFWAPWCPTCRSQIPQVQGIAETYGDRVHVVGIGSLDDAEAIADFAGDVPGITHLTDVDGAVWKEFGVVEQSSFVVLDSDGQRVFEAGYGGADDLSDRVGALVG